MLPETGHLNPSFPLARALANRGHEIVYTSVLDLRAAIEARGFRCVCLHRDVLRRGRLEEIDGLRTGEERNVALGQIRDRVEDDYFDGTVEELIRTIDPAIIVADVITLSPLQYVSHRLGIPCLQISTSLSQRLDELPPLISHLSPRAPRLELETARWESSSLRYGTPAGVSVANILTSTAEHYCTRFDYPAKRLSFESVFTPTLTLFPEIVLCASAFDFPRKGADAPTYVALPVDLGRRENVPDALESFIDGKRPLIYASLGSQSGRYPEASRFFLAVVETMRARPDWHAVIVTGQRFYDYPVFAELPPNILLLRSAPQLWLLKRASVFVTHAGLGSIREAIALAAPMVAVPQQFDQLGNAARVEYHRIGVQIPAEAVSAASLTSAIGRVLPNQAAYKKRLARLDQACRDEEDRETHLDMVEHVADSTRGSSALVSRGPAPPETAAPVRGWVFVGAAGFVSLPAGKELHDTRAQRIGVGEGGFTICPDLLHALRRAGGASLARVEVSGDIVHAGVHVAGRTLRCLWSLDVSEVLCDYAMWCVAQAFAPDMAAAAESATAFTELVRQYHALRRGGASPDVLFERSSSLFAHAAPLWHHGTGAAAVAASPRLHEAARGAQRLAARSLVRIRVGALAGTAEGAELYARHYHVVAAQFAAELERRVHAHIHAAKLDVDPARASR
jgi:zeaxanthin glucosyltransferase